MDLPDSGRERPERGGRVEVERSVRGEEAMEV